MALSTLKTPSPKLLDQLSQSLRDNHYSPRAVEAYVHWAKWYICFHGFRHPINMGAHEVRQFLAYLVSQHDVSSPTYIHALCALLFLYKKLLKVDIGWIDNEQLPRPPRARKTVNKVHCEQLEIPLFHMKPRLQQAPSPCISQANAALFA